MGPGPRVPGADPGGVPGSRPGREPGRDHRRSAHEVVYIACPPAAHKEYALAAIEAGKTVFCEKPLGVDVAESRALVARVEESGTPNAVNFP
ncbi:MAG: Gfo/Idh/MocA family oxidoreductase, partial [Proteobacteria bacterium]|nr:Gfo/Idh/MocA family oxidoreductase [Pseudomonadota bacterium]